MSNCFWCGKITEEDKEYCSISHKNEREVSLSVAKQKANQFRFIEGKGTLKEQAWKHGENMADWQRRVCHGAILKRLQTSARRKQYEKKQEAQVIEAIEDMKEEASMMASGVFG